MTERPTAADDSQELIRAALSGDSGAVDELLVRHISRLRAYVRLRMGQLVRSKESSEDLVQSICREVLEGIDRFEYRGEASFRHWLFRRAEHKIIDRGRFHRRQRRDPGREQEADDEHDAETLLGMASLVTPSRDAVAREELARLETAFLELPEDYREVVILARIVGLKHEEIAERMGKTESATWNLLSRALARLATLLDR